MIRGGPDARVPAFFGACLLLGLFLRVAWPHADPAARLSWSSGTYTDPPGNTLPARYAAQFGDADLVPIPERHVYPLLNAIARAGFEIVGPGRLATQIVSALLGIAAVLVVSAAASRAGGDRAGALCLLLGATDWWHGMYSRILVAEHVVALGLAASAWFALGRTRRDAMLAGVLAAIAAFFGKFHAVAFLPALLAFLALRGGAREAVRGAGGILGVAVVWGLTIFLPNRAGILEWLAESSVGEAGGSPLLGFPGLLLEPFATFREAWLFHRLPIVAGVAAVGLTTYLGGRSELRRRIDDGSALFALWIVALFVYHAALPYRAPRYFVPLVLPLIALGSIVLAEWLGGRSPVGSGRPSSIALFLGLTVVAFGGLDLLKHLEAIVREELFPLAWVRAGGGPADLAIVYDVVGSLPRHVLVSLVLAIPLFLAARRLGTSSPERRAGLAGAAVALAVVGNLAQWGAWIGGRTGVIEEAKESLRGVVAENAVVLGGYAPLLTLDSNLLAIPRFGRWERLESLTAGGATHVLLAGPSEREEIVRRFPGAASMKLVQEWPVRAGWGRRVGLFRLPGEGGGYEPGAFERAVDRATVGDWPGALTFLASLEGPPLPDALVLEARCRFELGELERAEALLMEAVDRRPLDPSLYLHLGMVAAQQGDEEGTRAYWERGLRVAPADPDLREAILRAEAGGVDPAGS